MTIQIGDASANAVFTDIVQQAQSLGSLNATNSMTLRGQANVTVQFTGGSGTNTELFEASSDGTNYTTIQGYPVAGGAAITSVANGASGHWFVPVAGFNVFRVRMSAFTSGSVLVSVVASQGSQIPPVSTTGNAREDLIAWGGTALGTPTNFGTTPTAVVAGSVNSSVFIGTTVAVAASAGVQKVGISGNAGASVDGVATGTAPANALYIGARAQNANPTAATNGQIVAVASDLAGRLITTPLNYRTLFGATATTISATGATTVAAAGGASVFRDIVSMVITTAGAAAQTITVSDGTLSWILDYPNAAVAPGSPLVIVFGDTPLRATTANTAWTANQSVATACHYLVHFVDRLA